MISFHMDSVIQQVLRLPLVGSMTRYSVSPVLRGRAFDVGLSERPEAPPGGERLPLLAANEVCVLPPGHALAAKAVLQPQDFAKQPFISLAPSDPYRQQIDAAFAQAGDQRQMRLATASAASVCAWVQAGVGVG